MSRCVPYRPVWLILYVSFVQVPVGKETLGRIINVIGEPVDEQGPVSESPASVPGCSRPHQYAIVLISMQETRFSVTSVINTFLRFSAHTCGCCADAKHHLAIHREAPPFVEQSTEQEILVTGIKVWHFGSWMPFWWCAGPQPGRHLAGTIPTIPRSLQQLNAH